ALSVFDRIDLAVRDPNSGLFGTKKENLPVRGIDVTFRFTGKAGHRAPDVLGSAAWITRQEQRREHIAAHYRKQRPREGSHFLRPPALCSRGGLHASSPWGYLLLVYFPRTAGAVARLDEGPDDRALPLFDPHLRRRHDPGRLLAGPQRPAR